MIKPLLTTINHLVVRTAYVFDAADATGLIVSKENHPIFMPQKFEWISLW